LEALEICQRWKILYGCDVALEWNDTDSGDLVAKKLEGGGGENTRGGVDGEIVFLKYGKKLTKMVQVFLKCPAGNQMVEWQMTKQAVIQALESLCCVCETKWHEKILPQAEGCDDCCLLNVTLLHGHLMITLNQFNTREQLATI
jgi:hypothetical protein